jgi:hypothetical protein
MKVCNTDLVGDFEHSHLAKKRWWVVVGMPTLVGVLGWWVVVLASPGALHLVSCHDLKWPAGMTSCEDIYCAEDTRR